MKIGEIILSFCLIMVLLNSCKSKNDIEYMQDVEQLAADAAIKNSRSTIQPRDEITILVTAKDMAVAAPFNQGTTPSTSRVTYSTPSGNDALSNQSSLTGFTYKVYDEGYIDFPYIGKVNTNGKTIEDLKNELVYKISKYIINPTVNIKYANYKVTILGEVAKPGQYIIPDGKVRLLDALGMAGDLTIYGKRDRVLIIREQDGVRTNAYVDLTSGDFVNSPYYYLQQNDVVAVAPNKTKVNSSIYGPQTGVYISIASIVVTILALVIRK